MEKGKTATGEYVLPASLVGHADLARLIREVEAVDGELEAQKVRGTAAPRLPVLSEGLSDFLEQNKLDIAEGRTLMELKERLRVLKDHAPVIHLTFATPADPEPLQELVAWLRAEIDPRTLVSVGLQPSLVGGVYMRTPNHVHDFTLKELLAGKREIILKELEELRGRGAR